MSARPATRSPIPLDDVPAWDLDVDVLVVGFGAAGASAALEAAEAGARVGVLEVASGHGGTTALAGGYVYFGGGGGTPAQRAAGFHDRTEDFAAYMALAGGPDADEARVRHYAEHALEHHDWLERRGVRFARRYRPGKHETPEGGGVLVWTGNEQGWPFAEAAAPAPRGHLPESPGELGGRRLVDALAECVAKHPVERVFDARVTALVQGVDEDAPAAAGARVQGVAYRRHGRDGFARARRGVILCAGGFVLNEAMLRRHAPQVTRLADDALSAGHDDGSGIVLGLSVGGAAIHMDELFTTLPIHPPEAHAKGVLVDARGQRFVAEDAYPGRIASRCLRSDADRFFLLVDDAIFEPPTALSRIEVVAVEESWPALERAIGLPEGALVSTLERYNLHAAKGEDPFFHKQAKWLEPLERPPFAALACHLGEAFVPYFTLGGLHTRPTGEVLTPNEEVIPGLFAAGRTACGLPRWGEGYSSGMSLADCTYFGRLAGRRAAGIE